MTTQPMIDLTQFKSVMEIFPDIKVLCKQAQLKQQDVLVYANAMVGEMNVVYDFTFPYFYDIPTDPNQPKNMPGIRLDEKVTYMNVNAFHKLVVSYFVSRFVKLFDPQLSAAYQMEFNQTMNYFMKSPQGIKSKYRNKNVEAKVVQRLGDFGVYRG